MAQATVDLVLRGGTIVDGTGAPAFKGDIAISGSKIQAVGPSLPILGREEYDVKGLLVTPGWIDVHTHFDGQVMWDAYLTPSTANGVTTCIFGNCGIGFAPVVQDKQSFLIKLIESLEDIPGTALHEGLKWEWETFEEYLDALKKRELACDVGVMIGHSAVRAWVMGERANLSDRPGGQKRHPVGRDDVEGMAALVRDAVAAGAMGFSTSRAIYHRDAAGVLTPGSTAQAEEVRAIGRAVAEAGGGIFQVTTDFSTYDDIAYERMDGSVRAQHEAEEWQMYKDVLEDGQGKVKLSLGGVALSSKFPASLIWGRDGPLEFMAGMNQQRPGSARMQTFVRPQWFLMSWVSRVNPFMFSKTLHRLRASAKSESQLLSGVRRPETREAILAEAKEIARQIVTSLKAGKSHPFAGPFTTMFSPTNLMFPWQESYEPDPSQSVAAVAQREGRHVFEVMYDVMTPASGEAGVVMKPLHSYQGQPLDEMRELFLHPMCVAGGDDAGAHVGIFTDASNPTHLLTHWVRDRTMGPKIRLEDAVRKHTGDLAEHFNLTDRGSLAPGLKADINVIALDKLQLHRPVWRNDLPTGAGRWVQSVDGYEMTLVSGRKTFEAGQPTGALPGRLVANPLADSKAWRGDAWRVVAKAGAQKDAEDLDLRAYALQKAQGGGASSIARLARDIEQGSDSVVAKSRL
mmetsp:Transcript_130204/g.404974  ORF Transcript_130204/g.404974 Transcript_130204/m.404974 type:complete len:686 (-) Transcript_130204:80-2137(-)|eukprot:CAMPEP_0204586468 /NCGR_PEP_ID=MMETSP0661-20131031/47505_1 /ASSEMBLY_ACC=CAM_ASM_000606 /TAXON_ID=109239 /ORGANISM="Alexandrium margalefi, Strain AMGDE01CS-322" /LENGTH=685 /DNA_ID=CAMNT_0051596109 /DNA_START=69 /DNA_END=2126 /DNA_ORIENTATION=+